MRLQIADMGSVSQKHLKAKMIFFTSANIISALKGTSTLDIGRSIFKVEINPTLLSWNYFKNQNSLEGFHELTQCARLIYVGVFIAMFSFQGFTVVPV